VLPVATLPDMAWGAVGRLSSVDYPTDWAQVRSVLESDAAPGDVVSLPWSTFRRFDWNLGRTVLDPAPRAMPRTVVTDTSLVVRVRDVLVVVPGDDPRSVRIGAAVHDGAELAPVLRREGIGWAVVAKVGAPVTLPTGAQIVVDGPDLALYRLAAPARMPSPDGRVAVITADVVAVVLLLGAAVAALRRARGQSQRDSLDSATGW
jgi:hypothetical protein